MQKNLLTTLLLLASTKVFEEEAAVPNTNVPQTEATEKAKVLETDAD